MATFFTIIFGLACLATFACGLRDEWKGARMFSATVAILSFLIALLSVGGR